MARSFYKSGSILVLALGLFGAILLSEVPTEALFRPLSNPFLMAVFAFLFCAFGDLFLSREGILAFCWGVISFGLGQLCFIYAILIGVPEVEFAPIWYRIILAIIPPVLFVLIPRSYGFLMRCAVMLYCFILLTMAWFAYASGISWIFYGAALFVFSDLLIAIGLDDRMPEGVRRVLSHLVWATYWPAQILLLWGFSLAL